MYPARKLFSNVSLVKPGVRAISVKSPMTDLTVDNNGVAVLTMQRPPVNSLNLELLQALGRSLDEADKNQCKGLILTSSSPTVFSAGIDITEMYKPKKERLEEFRNTLNDVWLKLYGSKFATVAAINGHCPGGGCVLAMCCDYRVMVSGKYTIGLNETALGVYASTWIMDSMKNIISQRQAELALTTGKLFTVDEALQIGLIDEVATDKTECIEKSKNFLGKFEGISSIARAVTKQKIRQGPITSLQNNCQADTKEQIANLMSPEVQQNIEKYYHSLKTKTVK